MNQFLTFISDSTDRKGYYQCVCGNTVEFRKDHVSCGQRKSCGCQTKDGRINNTGRRKHPLYNIWSSHHSQNFPDFELFVAELGNSPFEGATVVPLTPGTKASPGNVGWGRPIFTHGEDRITQDLFMPLDPKQFGQYNIEAYKEETDPSSWIYSLRAITKQYDKLREEYKDDPVALEAAVEDLSVTEGIQKFERSEKKASTKMKSAHSTTWQVFKTNLLPLVIERMLEVHQSAISGRSGIHHHIVTPILQTGLISHEEIAHIGLVCILDALGDGTGFKTPLTRVYKSIGQRIDDQCWSRWYSENCPSDFKYVEKWILSSNDGYHKRMRKAVLWIQENATNIPDHAYKRLSSLRDDKGKLIGDDPLVHLGEWIFQAIQSCTLWFAAEKLWDPSGKTDHKAFYLGLSPEGMRWKDLIQAGIKEILFEASPMVVEPIPWPEEYSKDSHGGYLKPQPLNFSKLIHGHKGTVPSPEAIRSLNKLQEVGWKVNPFMFHTLASLLGKNIKIGKFVCHERGEFLDQNWPDIDPSVWMLEKDDPEYRKAKAKIARMYSKCISNEQLAENPYRCLKTAAKFINYDRFHFPCYFDNRLRIYYLHTSGFHPQGANFAKSLLLFADPLPVTDENRESVRRDLLISISNCYGNDKISLDDRVTFAEELVKNLENVAKEPLAAGHMAMWTGVAEPFTFLATLRQYHEIFTWKTRYDTDIPCGRDAASSGLQLMGSLMREEKSMRYTNVRPGDKPADLYAEVSRHAVALLDNHVWLQKQMDKRIANAEKRAKKNGKELDLTNITYNLNAAEHITRKTSKRAVMTDSYNASWLSKNAYVSEELVNLEGALGRKVTLAEKAIVTTAIIDGQAQAFPVCRVVKIFFSDVVRKTIGELKKTEVIWSTPCGSIIKQRYNVSQVKQIQTFAMGGSRLYTKKTEKRPDGAIYLTLSRETDEVNDGRHTLSLSPNVHHSYDAYICQQAILGAETDSVATCHDCFYYRAGEVEENVQKVRDAFYRLVTSDVLERLLEANGIEDMLVPCFGDDSLLADALSSPYMFH
jgi:DNA-directed RNA polymerase